jgi:peptidoglycan glycosyltransferase
VKLLRQNIRLIALLMAVLLLSLILYGAFSISSYGRRWFSSGANNYLRRTKANVTAGTIIDRNNLILATSGDGKRQYVADETMRRSLVHVVGDSANNVAYGVESFMASYLYAFNESYPERLFNALQGRKRRGNDIRISIDARLSKKAYELFPVGKSGAVVVMNYRTGELLVLQSYPSFDPGNITQIDKDNPQKPFWNRATKWISAPGSTFKVITMASALSILPDAMTRTFECLGSLPLTGTTITDASNAVHHQLNLQKALVLSCNITFAKLALELGDANLSRTAAAFGFGDYFLFSDLVVENSSYPTTNRTEKEIAWTGPGQSSLQTTPLHMCLVASAIANKGIMMEPRLLLQATNSAGENRYTFRPKVYKTALSETHADILRTAMLETVRRGTATRAAVADLRVCAKTGSAQMDGQQETNAWVIGFIDDPRYPYAACVVVEDAGAGGTMAAPIMGRLFAYIHDQGITQ